MAVVQVLSLAESHYKKYDQTHTYPVSSSVVALRLKKVDLIFDKGNKCLNG